MSDRDHYRSRSRLSRRTLLRSAGVAGAGLAGAALIGCGSSEESTPAPTATTASPASTQAATATPTAAPENAIKRGGVYKNHATGDPPTIHPYNNHSFTTKGFAAYVYSRLYQLGTGPLIEAADALPVPDLAESAESTDGQHWVVKLRQDAKFQNIAPVNGRAFDAEDVLYSFGLLTAPESVLKDDVKFITDLSAVDSHTLSFTLDAPSPTFLDTISDANYIWVMPKEADGGFDAAVTPIGTGPWIMDQYEVTSRFVFKANPDYYDSEIPYLDGLDQAIIPEYANALAQFRAGNLDQIGVASVDVLDLRSQMADVQWQGDVSIGLTNVYFSGPEMDADAPWRDERFRQAISMAQDRDGILELGYNIKSLQDAGLDVSTVWNNIVPAGYGKRYWVDPRSAEQGDSAKFFEHNLDEAKKLLAAVEVGDTEIPVQWAAGRYGTQFESVAEALANMFADAGLNIAVTPVDYNSVYITQTVRGQFHGIAIGPMTPYPEVGGHVNKMFVRQPYTAGGLGNDEVVQLGEAQAVELDPEQRGEIIKQIQRVSGEHMLYAPSSYGAGTGWTALQPQVRGIRSTRGYGAGTELYAHYWLDA